MSQSCQCAQIFNFDHRTRAQAQAQEFCADRRDARLCCLTFAKRDAIARARPTAAFALCTCACTYITLKHMRVCACLRGAMSAQQHDTKPHFGEAGHKETRACAVFALALVCVWSHICELYTTRCSHMRRAPSAVNVRDDRAINIQG